MFRIISPDMIMQAIPTIKLPSCSRTALIINVILMNMYFMI